MALKYRQYTLKNDDDGTVIDIWLRLPLSVNQEVTLEHYPGTWRVVYESAYFLDYPPPMVNALS